ncbi:hypothetical protein P168DRAFT_139538 [Aspergillus campestris IBT 28561]|uniref:Protein kinase domain-containing protein n=1 Tax=Aspergillus campestris (strain IBT 28561) TaxID=1392248 RepID=A0A2I1D4K5_ASPC2|nr:uncharacterized protein P168DRAFT_139538 [Aspergillus campestris IBT 28561]PKY04799.1 hypothetical protein P168DRAFT_139538 [Aspergillus campestris IBT 28561]
MTKRRSPFDLHLEDETIDLPNGDRWKLGKRIAQAAYDRDSPYHEIRQIYDCVQVTPDTGHEAVLKIRAQMSADRLVHPDPATRAIEADPRRSPMAVTECCALDQLYEKNCASTARLIYWCCGTQTENLWVPNGCITFIFMERLSGTDICDFWAFERGERDRVRGAFKEAFLDLIRCGIHHGDPGFRNIIWDSEKGKCYLIDFDNCYFVSEESAKDFYFGSKYTSIFYEWGLDNREMDETD